MSRMLRQRLSPNRVILSLALACLLVVALRAQAQQPSIHYIYDDVGRLVGMVDQTGNAATLGGPSQVTYITRSGREVPADQPMPKL